MSLILSIHEAIVLAAMPERTRDPEVPWHTPRCTYSFLYKATTLGIREIRKTLHRLRRAGLVELMPEPMAGWQLTSEGNRRRAKLLGFEQAVTTLIGSAARSGGVGDRFLAGADVRPGPSRAMYPASVLQGRGG
jgi:DNA-binding transcriptional ArsR family regulator